MIPRNSGVGRRARTTKSGTLRSAPSRVGPEVVAEDAGDVAHPDELAGGEEALAGRRRCRQGAEVDVDEVADVDDLEPDPRGAGHVAAQHAADDLHGAELVIGQDRTEHGAGQDRGELRSPALAPLAHAGLLLGEGLGSR